MFSLTNLFGKAVMYLVIALWKLEKPIVRKAPAGAFRFFMSQTNIFYGHNMNACSKYVILILIM